jgi:CheY-like chemotaxis protein
LSHLFNIEELIINIKSILRYDIIKTNIQFNYYIDSDVSNYLYGDSHNITHVLINIIKNAIKYSEENRKNIISLNIKTNKNTIVTQEIIISVSDTNSHILPNIKDKLFESFNSTSGSGLGLYICKTIIELHGGKILHEFLNTIGNKFIVHLELKVYDGNKNINKIVNLTTDQSTQIQKDNKILKEHNINIIEKNIVFNQSNNDFSQLEKNQDLSILKMDNLYNVMIIDDSVLNRKLMYKTLKTNIKINNIFTSENGLAAFCKICNHMNIVDIILIDKHMPKLNGIVTVKLLREIKYDKLIFGISGINDIKDLYEFIENGADYVFIKPFDKNKINQLFEFINNYGVIRQSDKKIKLVDQKLEWI